MPKLYLHAGTHQTGTTALQNFANSHRNVLLARGLFYADYGRDSLPLKNAHNQFAHAIVHGDRETQRRLTKIVEYWRSVSENEGVPVLVSAEALWRHTLPGLSSHWEGRSAYVGRLAELLEPFEVEVILVYRRPDDFARSMYQERVNYGLQRLPDFSDWLTLDHPVFEYSMNASAVCSPFGEGSHYIYEDLIRDDGLYVNFFSKFGVSVDGLSLPKFTRRSLTPAETAVKNYANLYIDSPEEGRRFIKWMRREKLTAEIDNSAKGTLSLWESADTRSKFLQGRRGDILELQRNFFDSSSSEHLFPELEPGGDYVVPRISPTVAEQVEAYFSR